MTKVVTRYEMEGGCGPWEGSVSPREDSEGEWVKYEDIKHLLQAESPAARTCRCDSAKAEKCSGGDMMLICRCECHAENRPLGAPIEERAREHFYKMHRLPLSDVWDVQPEATKESYRDWARKQLNRT